MTQIHWTHLKKRVEEMGGTWTNREDAEKFLAEVKVVGNVSAPVEPVKESRPSGARFDPDQPHGMVSGEIEGMPGARYFQAGRYFTATGKQVG